MWRDAPDAPPSRQIKLPDELSCLSDSSRRTTQPNQLKLQICDLKAPKVWRGQRFPGGARSKETACQCRRHKIPRSGRSLEKSMAIHSSILAWRIPWTEDPGADMTEVT